MTFKKLILLCLFTSLHFHLAATKIDVTTFTESNIIERDVCIIGGGASGTYAAVRLLQSGKSVALIEKKDRLGGHVNTYVDPITKLSFDFGVQFFDNITVVLNYAKSLNTSLISLGADSPPKYANFGTGKLVTTSIIPSITAQEKAFLTYRKIANQYSFLNNGFDLPHPVPEDLLISFGEFIQKYNLSAMAVTSSNLGVGNILTAPTLYMMKYLPPVSVDGYFVSGKQLTTFNQNNQGLYNNALDYIGNHTNVFLSSKITQIERDDCGVQVVVSNPDGEKLIKASKLLISIPPNLENLESIHLDLVEQENSIFGQFINNYYWNMVIKNTGLPNGTPFIVNVQPEAPDLIATEPSPMFIQQTQVTGLYVVDYGSPHNISNDQVKADVLATLARIDAANGFSTNSTPEIVAFDNHSPYELRVPSEAIKNGFYGDLNALQGQRNTWWTGAAFHSPDSSLLWNWTEYNLLPKILASL